MIDCYGKTNNLMDIYNVSPDSSVDEQSALVLDFNNQHSLKSPSQFQNNKSQVMGVENTWSEEDTFAVPPAADFPIPLPPPSGFDDYSNCAEATVESDPFPCELEALFSPNDHNGDVSDINGEAGVCGLRNLGNTCFMSTGVQCLMATPSLVRCLMDKSSETVSDSLTAQLAALTNKMWSGQYSSVQPADFKNSLGVHYPQFKDFRQHDCQEFLALLLDGLHEQLNSAEGKFLTNIEAVEKFPIDKLVEVDGEEKCTSGENERWNECCSSNLETDPNSVQANNNNNNNNSSLVNKINTVKEHISPEKNNINFNDDLIRSKELGESSVSSISSRRQSPLKTKSVLNSNLLNHRLLGNNQKSSETDRNVDSSALNNYSQCLTGLEDIMKDAKTSNVNVLVTEQEANNEIRFDSEKYPKSENVRRRDTLNFNMFHIYDNNMTSGKRVKSTVTHYNSVAGFREGLDLKRIKMHRLEHESDNDQEKNQRMECERRSRVLDINLVEKNLRIECERKHRELSDIGMDAEMAGASGGLCEPERFGGDNGVIDKQDGPEEADNHWEKHLATNQSIIVDTFQGQFKSTVVCSACKYVSVTYEPFMYLSVPLPHAMERQICVTFVPANGSCPTQYLVTLNKRDKVSKLKEQLLQLLDDKDIKGPIILAEVLENHIAKILNDNHLIRYVDDVIRSIYAFELGMNFEATELESTESRDHVIQNGKVWEGEEDEQMSISESCTICLEEKESNMQRHLGCNCVLCDACVTSSFQHYGGDSLVCPVCRIKLTPGTDLVAVEKTLPSWPTVGMLHVPLVFRIDTLGDGNNNKKTVRLFGHPGLLRVPNNITCQGLHSAVASTIPYADNYKILLVDGQGHHCSRCMFNEHCRGCAVGTEGPLTLHTSDTLAITFIETVEEHTVFIHSSMSARRSQQSLTIYDCIQAFSQSEVLDKQNPWYCPKCQQNQCATKTLSVWRYPDYLIVYLKRFVFHDGFSTKLEDKVMFPLHGLNLSPYTSFYDLYACVCHIGGVSAGHYTSYTQHPHSGEWHYYNDDYVTKQGPQDEDFSNAYILFYKKRGLVPWNAESDATASCSSNGR